ncbi:MAG: HI0074 family nucleotidyltransferase substrate-binding subunit [Gallionella sp.]
MNTERYKERRQELITAVQRLEEACAQPFSSFIRDSVIQRFEFCWELAWKTLRLKLEAEGIIANTPRETWQQALQVGLITDGNAWSEAQKKRNLTSHTYDEKLADEVYGYVLQHGLPLFQQLANSVASWSR